MTDFDFYVKYQSENSLLLLAYDSTATTAHRILLKIDYRKFN